MTRALPVALFVLAFGQAFPGQQQTATEVARAVQQHYDGVRDFSADFVHAYEGGVLRKTLTERGEVLVKKPGKMRWTYTAPERKLFVSDGVRLYSYVPADKQVIVSRVPAEDEANTAVMFLAGKGSLTRDFTVSFAEEAQPAAEAVALKLVPEKRQQEYDWLTLVVDRRTLELRRLVTVDSQGGQSTFTFSKLKENVGIADNLFSFTIPRGVDVLSDGRTGK
jgi:outer membrane lipoprotein carrier protein